MLRESPSPTFIVDSKLQVLIWSQGMFEATGIKLEVRGHLLVALGSSQEAEHRSSIRGKAQAWWLEVWARPTRRARGGHAEGEGPRLGSALS